MKRVLVLNQMEFSYDRISSGEFDDSLLSDFEKNTLCFCKDWLNDKRSFELHTSGSTGNPKKIDISRRQMEASAWLTINKLGLSAGDTALVCIDTAYIGGKMMLVRALEADLNIIAVEPASDPFEKIDPCVNIDFTAVVPMQLKIALEKKHKNKKILDGMKAVIVGGGAIDLQLETAVQAILAPVYSTYGMTETVSHIALKKINEPGKDQCFKAFDNIEIGQDGRSCLTVKGPVTNNETIITNDIVNIIDDHSFQWIGRADNVINSGGIKINAEKLEQQIHTVVGDLLKNRRFFVAGIKEQILGEQVTLFLEGTPFAKNQEEGLLRKLKAGLPLYHHPRKVVYMPYFIETPTGKINRTGSLSLHLKNS